AAYIVGQLGDEDFLSFTSALAATDLNAIVLLDTPGAAPYLKRFLQEYRPDRVVPVGTFADDATKRDQRLGVSLAPALKWSSLQAGPHESGLFAQAERVVLCPAQPRGLLLQAACLAGVARAPLLVIKEEKEGTD